MAAFVNKCFLLVAISIACGATIHALEQTVRMPKNVSCGETCSFSWCKPNGLPFDRSAKGRRLLLRSAGLSAAPYLCHDTKRVGTVHKFGTAMVKPARDASAALVPIINYLPTGLRQRFARKFFGLGEITSPPLPGLFGFNRMRFKKNQKYFVNDLCIVIPLKSYDILDEEGNIRKREFRNRPMEDCISFKTVLAEVLIDLTWNTGDDLDLSVIEPSGEILSGMSLTSANGRHNGDNNIGVCDIQTIGREEVRFLQQPGAPKGEYGITVTQKGGCGTGPTTFSIVVYVNGEVAKEVGGTTTAENGETVITTTFTY